MKKLRVNEMSWSEFRDLMTTTDTIIIPVGVAEEHGKHSPLGTDSYIAEESADRLSKRTGIPVAPCMRYGYSPSVAEFPGTITIDPITFKKIMVSYSESFIRHGVKRIFFMNGHGGNNATLDSVCATLFDKHGTICTHSEWWEQLPFINPEKWQNFGHGDLYETAMLLTAQPDKVRMDLADHGGTNPFMPGMENGRYKGMRLGMGQSLWKVNKLGNVGLDPTGATLELGEDMMEDYLNFCEKLILELSKIDLSESLVK